MVDISKIVDNLCGVYANEIKIFLLWEGLDSIKSQSELESYCLSMVCKLQAQDILNKGEN